MAISLFGTPVIGGGAENLRCAAKNLSPGAVESRDVLSMPCVDCGRRARAGRFRSTSMDGGGAIARGAARAHRVVSRAVCHNVA
ncbi:hypothetical protein, partial [Ralstonia pseudosolanacearum]|uniref:hypothetical protein n=2 Tax=Ralstonia pseudosolanacearum TaxID=1310165 RepID=UPI003221415C